MIPEKREPFTISNLIKGLVVIAIVGLVLFFIYKLIVFLFPFLIVLTVLIVGYKIVKSKQRKA